MTVPGRARVTVNQKILVLLLDYAKYADRDDALPQTTQWGMSEALRVRRSHVTLALQSLERQALVVNRTTRIVGGARRKKAYSLTPLGYARAQETCALLKSMPVRIFDADDTEVVLAHATERIGGAYDLTDLLLCLRPDGVLDPRPLASPPASGTCLR